MNIGLLLDPYGEKSPGGLGRAIFEITHHLLALDQKNKYKVYLKRNPSHAPNLPGTHWSIVGLQSRYLWLTGAKRIDRNLDLYIFFTPIIPLFFRPKKSIVVALDWAYLAIAPHTVSEACAKRLLFYLHRRSLRLASKVIAISEQTKQETVHYFGIHPDKVEVIHIGFIEPSKKQQTVSVPDHFFFFGGALKERKNVAGILRGFAQYTQQPHADHDLIIAGKGGGAYHQSLVTLVRELDLQDKVRFLGYVSNEELAYLYSKATALVFPSLIEGFGMPVLEAMSVGLPVITSHKGALAEVADTAALLVDPQNPSSIAQALGSIAHNHQLRSELRHKGYARAAQFSWEKTAEGFVRNIEALSN